MLEREDLIQAKKSHKFKKINQPVFCKDYVIQQNDGIGSQGEFRQESFYQKKRKKSIFEELISPIYELGDEQERDQALIRLADLIKLLALIVNEYHRADNFIKIDEEWLPKEGHENNISRLITHEFAFYPANSPFTIREFKNLIALIESMSANLHENFHLILSSFPVLHNNGIVTNHVIHVHCGKKPILNVLVKENPSRIDPVYLYTHHRKLQKGEKENPLRDRLLRIPFINLSGVVLCRTVGGAKFYTVIEICYDHRVGVGKKNYHQEITLAKTAEKKKLIPKQLTQVITAGGMTIFSDNIINKTVLLVDRDNNAFSNNVEISPTQPEEAISLDAIQAQFAEIYPKICIVREEDNVVILAPPFGGQMVMRILKPYQLEEAKDWGVGLHNVKIVSGATEFEFYKEITSAIKEKLEKFKQVHLKLDTKKSMSPIQQLNPSTSAVGELSNESTLTSPETCRFFSGRCDKAQQRSLIKALSRDLDLLDLTSGDFERNLSQCLRSYIEFAKDIPNSYALILHLSSHLRDLNFHEPSKVETLPPRWDF